MAVHEDARPFSCCLSGCSERFAYRHVRDNHERTAKHLCCHVRDLSFQLCFMFYVSIHVAAVLVHPLLL
jgi:hypothetical protein